MHPRRLVRARSDLTAAVRIPVFITVCIVLIAACILLVIPRGLHAQPATSTPADDAPCSAPEYRQFDFWLGEWQVRRAADSTMAGINRIESEHGGCVIHERYATGRGYSGESFSMYDASRRVWHQTWVDSSGLLLLLEGRLTENAMILEGQTIGEGGRTVRHRITWTPNADGSVRQYWESTDANGKWTVTFDGRYTKG